MHKLNLGTRGSKLALWQSHRVAEELQKALPALEIDIKTIKTQGDKILDVALSRIGDKGLFTKEIENELLVGNIDLAVHSMKDLPGEMDPALDIGAVLHREDPRDVLISHKGYRFDELPEGGVLGTSSLRRIAQIKARRPDLEMLALRGNIETRIKKMQEQDLDGIVLAWAGVSRLGLTEMITDFLHEDLVLPAVGQGAIAVQIRADDHKTREVLDLINDKAAHTEVSAERSFLRKLQGGCQVPIGSRAVVNGSQIFIRGLICSLDGTRLYRQEISGPVQRGQELAVELAEELLAQGAGAILDEIRGFRN
ncbi:MAG: hydroxymethylbilane synthase [Syntrophomonas sp.]